MLVRSLALALCIVVSIPPAAIASASLRPLNLPVRQAGTLAIAPGTPSYAGDAFEIRVNSRASAALTIPARPDRLRQVGVPSLDRVAAALGAWFEPEFVGETRPAPGESGIDFTSFLIVHLPAGVRLETALASFAALGEVESVSPLAILPLNATPNDSLFALSPWFHSATGHDIHATEAWDTFVGDPRIVVAVLDAGVSASHPDLSGTNALSSGNIFTNAAEANGAPRVDDDGNGFVDDVHGWDFVNVALNEVKTGEDWRDEDNDPSDMVGHGTFCAGLIGALTNNTIGVAGTSWNVRILPVRIGYAYPGAPLASGEVRMDFVARGVRYATRMGAQVISMSFSNLDTDGLGAAVTAATHAGITVVTSAGNFGSPNELGNRPDVLSIAAVDGNDVVAAFSNTGPQIDLSAPGVGIRSTYIAPTSPDSLGLRVPGYGVLDGTSFSAPLVSGAVALLQGRELNAGRPLLSPAGVKLRLVESSDDIRAQNPGLDGQYGAGRLNLQRMLTIPTPSLAIPVGGTTVGPAAVITRKSGPARVAFATTDGKLTILDGATGSVLVTVNLPGPAATGVAAADLGGGHGLGMFVGTSDGSMAGFDITGAPLPGFPTTSIGVPLAGGPALGDIDGDGVLEVVCGADDGDLYAWHANGTLVTGFPRTTGAGRLRSPVALSEIDSVFAGVEIVACNEAGNLRVIRGNGSLINAFAKTYLNTPRPPIVTRYGEGATAIVVAEGTSLHAYRAINGQEFPGFPVTLDGPVLSDLAMADLDVDGVLDFVLATDTPAELDARDSTGAHLPGWPKPLGSGVIGAPVIGQLRGLSSLFELLIFRGSSLAAFTNTGDSLALRPESGGAGLQPTIVDLDGDGETDIVAGTGPDSTFYIYSGGPGSFTFGPTAWPTPRANMARTGSTRYFARPALIDDVPPGTVGDLAVTSVGSDFVVLEWTAPGDDGFSGTAESYQIKQSSTPITAANFDAAADVLQPPFPQPGGEHETFTVLGMPEGVTQYFALRAIDPAGNQGPISNVVNATTSAVAPAQVTDLRVTDVGQNTVSLAWTASGDDGNVGQASHYELRASTSPLTPANFDDAPYQTATPALFPAGGTETVLFTGLPQGAVLSIALKAVDAGGNASVLSNIVTARTGGGPLAGKVGIALAPGNNPGRPPLNIYWQADPAGALGSQRMRIYDLGGRVQRSIDLGPGNSGIVIWDGRNDDGERMPAGLYFLRLESGGHTAQSRVALLP